jgi:ParB-like chromosome segregation protein Spo0J
MSMKVNAGKVRRSDLLWVDPFQVEVHEELRGRAKAPSDDQIVEMACSLLDHTQLQPVVVRRGPENRLILTLGFTRTAAARLIRDGFKDADGKMRQDKSFALQVRVTEGNDQDAFVANVIENARRNATTPVDDAHNQDRLRTRYGMTDVEIAHLYGESATRVSRIKSLLRLDNSQQDLVHTGAVAVDAAIASLDLPDEERTALFTEAAKGQRVTGARVRRQVRDKHLRDEPDDAPPTGEPMEPSEKATKVPRTIKEVREFFEALSTATDSVSDPRWIKSVQKFAKSIQQWLAGTRSDKAACKAIDRLLASTPEPEPDEPESIE